MCPQLLFSEQGFQGCPQVKSWLSHIIISP